MRNALPCSRSGMKLPEQRSDMGGHSNLRAADGTEHTVTRTVLQ